MSRPCVKEFGNAFSRDRRRKPLTFNIIHRVVALDRIKASVRKRNKSADGDQGFDDQFVAIKRVAEFARYVGADTVDSHDAPLRRYATLRAQGARIRQIREDADSSGPEVSGSIRPGA